MSNKYFICIGGGGTPVYISSLLTRGNSLSRFSVCGSVLGQGSSQKWSKVVARGVRYRLQYYRNCCFNDVQFDNIEYFAKTKQNAYGVHACISLRGDEAG